MRKIFFISIILFLFVFIPCFVFADEVGLGEPCEADTECATGLCMYGVCAQCSGDGECPADKYCAEPTQYCFPKLENNVACDRNEMCKSALCEQSICMNSVKKSGCCKIGVKQDGDGGANYFTRTKFVDSEQDCFLIFSTNDHSPDIFDPKDQKEKWEFTEGQCEAVDNKKDAGSGKKDLDMPDVSGLNQLSTTNVQSIIGNIIKTGMGVMGSIALAMFVYGGVLWMTSAGNAEREKKGMQAVVWASLGVMVILLSYVIVKFVFETF